MKTKLLLALFVAAAGSTQADIILGAPGVPVGSRVAVSVPFLMDHQLTSSYKFVFMGIQAKGDTQGAPSLSTNLTTSQFHLKAMVSDNQPSPNAREGNLYFRDVKEFNSAPLRTILIEPAVIFKATNNPITITLSWQGNGNASKPNGWFNILGEYQKDPPQPVGSLRFDVGDFLLANAGLRPDGTAVIARE